MWHFAIFQLLYVPELHLALRISALKSEGRFSTLYHAPIQKYPWAPRSSIPLTLTTSLYITLECCQTNIMLTGWPFRSGASWSEKHACVPGTPYLCTLKCWLLPYANYSLLISAQNLMLVLVLVLMLLLLAAWMLAWSCLHGLNSVKRRALQLDEGDLIIDEMNGQETMELLVLCGAHLERLDMLLLGHQLPNMLTVYLLLTSFSSSSLACSLGFVQTPDASSAYNMQLWLCIVQGFAGLRLACNIYTPEWIQHKALLAKSSL